jgi:hypothetical protein
MSRCKLRTHWPIHFKLRTFIGIDSLTVCILFGEILIFHSRVMGLYSSNCRRFFVCRAVNWQTPSPIHFKLRTVIGIDSLYWFLKKCVVCINVPIHVYGAAVGEILIFHSRVMGKKVFTIIVWMLTTDVSCAVGAAVYFKFKFKYYLFIGLISQYIIQQEHAILTYFLCSDLIFFTIGCIRNIL